MTNMNDVLVKLGQVDMNKVGKANKHQTAEIDFMLSELQDNYSDLSDWEADFTDSLTGQFANKGNLSEKQTGKLRSIYEKVCM